MPVLVPPSTTHRTSGKLLNFSGLAFPPPQKDHHIIYSKIFWYGLSEIIFVKRTL